MSTIKPSKRSLNNFDDGIFYVNNDKCHPHDEIIYLLKRDLINTLNATSLDLDKNQLVNNFLELTSSDLRELIEAAIKLYNDLT